MENLIEELTKVNPASLSEEGLKLFNKINEIIDRNIELEQENRFLKKHEYTNICQCCKKEFYSKRPNVLWCKNCRTKMYNINYYANLNEDKRKERAEKSKIAMRKYRNKLQKGDK